jgi:hypothetical protein
MKLKECGLTAPENYCRATVSVTPDGDIESITAITYIGTHAGRILSLPKTSAKIRRSRFPIVDGETSIRGVASAFLVDNK